jgi:GAF domain-containing protein
VPLANHYWMATIIIPIDDHSIVGWVAQQGKPHISNNVAQDRFFHHEAILKETKSEISLPLVTRGKLLGVLDIQNDKLETFQDENIAIMQIMASQVAVNIDNAQLFSKAESQLNETQTLLELNSLLTTTQEVGEIYRRAAREFAIKLGGSRCAIASWEKEDNSIVTQAEFVHNAESKIDDAYITNYETHDLTHLPETKKVLKTHTPYLFHDNHSNQNTSKNHSSPKGHIYIELPLVVGVDAIGTVKIYRDSIDKSYNQQEIRLLQAMANQTAIALNNAILTSNTRGQLAQFSSLNRMSVILSQAATLKNIFDGARREILSLVEATGMSISLLTDDGKKLNWIYGYEFGQEVDLTKIPLLSIDEGFSGHVVRTREPLNVSEANKLREDYESVTVGADLSCWLGLPLIVANELIGVLAVENDTEFTSRDIDLLKTISGPLAIAINNLIQFEEIQNALDVQMRQRIQLEAAADVAATATSVLGMQELMQASVNLIKDRFHLYYVGLFLVDEKSNQAVLKAATGIEGERQLAENHQLQVGGQSLIGGAIGDGKSRIIQDVHQNKEWFKNPHLPETSSELALPLRVRGQVIGALTVQSVVPNVFDPDLLNILQTMTDQLAVAIENARLLLKAESEAHDQQLINQVSSQFYQSVDVNNIVKLGLEAISQRLGGSDVQLTLGTKRSDE